MLGLVSRVVRHAAPRAAPAFAAVNPAATATGMLPTMLRGFAAAASTGKITQIIGGASPFRPLRIVVQSP
jgi:DNA-binding NtrC family response regulator